MWTFAAGVGVWVTLRAGGDLFVVARLSLAAVMPFLVFLASFWGRSGYWKLSVFDLGCGALSLVSGVCWVLFADAPLSITFAGLADFFACLPTVVKAWRAPQTESALSFIIFALSTAVVLPLVTVWDVVHVGFVLYLTSVNALIAVVLLLSSWRSFLKKAI
jgi:hypothetical protein